MFAQIRTVITQENITNTLKSNILHLLGQSSFIENNFCIIFNWCFFLYILTVRTISFTSLEKLQITKLNARSIISLQFHDLHKSSYNNFFLANLL